MYSITYFTCNTVKMVKSPVLHASGNGNGLRLSEKRCFNPVEGFETLMIPTGNIRIPTDMKIKLQEI